MRLAQSLAKTDWPNGRALMTAIRANLPSMFLTAIGNRQGLGPAWAPGDPHWQRAHEAIAAVMDAEERRTGPVIPSDAAAFARVVVMSAQFTDDDLAFIDQLILTPYGRAIVEVMDHIAVNSAIQSVIDRPMLQPEAAREFQALRARIRENMGAVMGRLNSAGQAQREEATRLDAIMQRAGFNRQSGEAAGRELFQRPMERLAGLVVLDTMGTIDAAIEGFRRSGAMQRRSEASSSR